MCALMYANLLFSHNANQSVLKAYSNARKKTDSHQFRQRCHEPREQSNIMPNFATGRSFARLSSLPRSPSCFSLSFFFAATGTRASIHPSICGFWVRSKSFLWIAALCVCAVRIQFNWNVNVKLYRIIHKSFELTQHVRPLFVKRERKRSKTR